MPEPLHYLKMGDLSEATLEAVLRRAEEFRLLRTLRQPHATRPGTVLGMVCEKASARRLVLSTDVFTSMGQEAETHERLKAFAGFWLDGRLVSAADPTASVLH